MKAWRKLTQAEGGLYLPEEAGLIDSIVARRKGRFEINGMLCVRSMPEDPEEAEILNLGENLIVDLGKQALRKLQALTVEANGAAGTLDLGYLAVGDGGVSVLPGTTALTNELTGGGVPRVLLAVTAPAPGPPFTTNLWTGQIGPSDLNGSNIDEAALYCLDDTTMFAARSFAAQAKSAGIGQEYRWTIIF